MAIWQCCKCGMHNVQCSNPLCSHYQCEGCPQSYTSLLHSDDLDQSTPIASAQSGLHFSLAHPTQVVQQPQRNGTANIYPVINTGLGTSNLHNLNYHVQAQPQPQGSYHVQNNMPSVQPRPISMFMPNIATAITAPQFLGTPTQAVQMSSQTQMGYQGAGGLLVQGQTQTPNITSYTPAGNLHVLSSRAQRPTATGGHRQNTVPGFPPQVLVPSQQNTPRPVQQPTANTGYNQVPAGTLAPPPAPARQTSNRMNSSGPAMLRGTRASVRPRPYRRENPVAVFDGQRVNSVPRSMNGSATPLRVISTPARAVAPTPRVSVFTHPVHGMDTLNSGVNEAQVLRNQADGIQRLTGVQTPQTLHEEIQSRIAQMMAEEIQRAGPQVVPEEVQGAVPQTIPEEIQGGDPQTMPEEIQERDPYMMPDELLRVLPEGMYAEARAMLGIPEPVTARLAPMQVQPAASQPTQGTVDYRSIDWQGPPWFVSPLSGMGIFLSGLDPERLFRGTGIRVTKPGEVPTMRVFVPAELGGQVQAVTAGMGNVQLGGGTGEEEEDDEDDTEEESEEGESEGEDEEDEEEAADGEEDDEEGGAYVQGGEEEEDDEDDEDGGAPLNAHWQGNDGDSDGEEHSEGPSYPDRQLWHGQTGGFGAPFYQG